jgi:TonB family protein
MKAGQWKESNPLTKVKVAAPCPAEWRFMYGNDRVRFCNQCQLNVYNLSAMTKTEAEDLIRNAEGRLCVKFYRRADGTILTQNCPVGLRTIKEKLNRTRTHIIGAALSLLGCFGFVGSYKFAARIQERGGLFPPYQREVIGIMNSPNPHPTIQNSESFIREKALFKVSPIYKANRFKRINGEAVVKITINEIGEVATAVFSKGNPLFKEIAEDAARRWKFEPMQSDDLPARVESHLTFRFR